MTIVEQVIKFTITGLRDKSFPFAGAILYDNSPPLLVSIQKKTKGLNALIKAFAHFLITNNRNPF
jgi:hypothetical protein